MPDVSEPKAVKNRMHVDIRLRDEAHLQELLRLGATVIAEHDGRQVLADPDGNEFCAKHPNAGQTSHTDVRSGMVVCMRATINLPDSLADAAKARARAEGRTFTSLIEEGLRSVLSHADEPTPIEPLPAYGDPQGRLLVDLSDRDALWSALDADGTR